MHDAHRAQPNQQEFAISREQKPALAGKRARNLLAFMVALSASTTFAFTVTPSTDAGGSISPNTPQTVTAGNTTTFALTPGPGNIVVVGGTCGGNLAGPTYTTAPINADCTVIATHFSAEPATLGVGQAHNCTVSSTGGVVCWGANDHGQLGDGTTTNRTTAVNVIGVPFGVTSLASGSEQSCAVTASGAAKCWGYNNFGQIGDNSTTDRLTAVDVLGLGTGQSRMSAGTSFTCALSAAGGVKCWGKSNNGQLGNGLSGINAQSLTAVDVSGLTSGVRNVTAGYEHACAVTTAGAAKCWGSNYFWELGGTDTSNTAPAIFATQVDVLGMGSGVAAMAAGSAHTCALTVYGGVKCWGTNAHGELGTGNPDMSTLNRSAVNVISMGSGNIAIAAGQFHTCAITSARGVKCWGENSNGQVGDGTTTQRASPVDVSGLGPGAGVVAISAGLAHTCALINNGNTVCWGANPNGQLGNGASGGPSFVPTATIYPASTSTMVASGLNPSVFGDAVTLTATVTGGTNGALVAFQDGGVNISACSGVALAAGTAACTTSALNGGARSIAAIYLGNSATLASTSAALSQAVNPAAQTITFDPLANKQDTDPPFTVSALASSGQAVVFSSSTPGICTVSGNTVTIGPAGNAGTCTIAANQSGNGNYNAAPQVTQSFTVNASVTLSLVSVVSRKVHGTAGTFDIAINPLTAISGLIDVEPRAIGAGHTIVFSFNIPVTSIGTVTSVDATSTAIGSVSPVISGNDVIVTLTGIPDNRRAKITVPGVNGTGLVPSASIGFLIGDQNNSRSITGTDIGVIRGRSGQAVTATNFRSDLNASGTLTGTDVSIVRPRSGLVIPP